MAQDSASPRVPNGCDQCPVRPFTLYSANGNGTPAEIGELRKGVRVLPARRTIYREGETSNEIFTLFDGWAFRFKVLPDGRRSILSFLLPGDLISVPLLHFDRLHFSVQSLTAVSLCVFERAALVEYVRNRPALARRFESFCGRETALAEERLADVGRRSARERVARLILRKFQQLQARNAVRGSSFEFPLRQQHVADALGLTAVHVSRVLNALRTEGLVAIERGRLTIIDRGALIRTAAMRQGEIGSEAI